MRGRHWRSGLVWALAWLGAATGAVGQGIPEPGLTLYGQVRNVAAGSNLVTYGTLQWTVQAADGARITVTAPLTNINDQFSYVVQVSFETPLPGLPVSAGTLALSSVAVVYVRSAAASLTGAGYTAALVASPASTNFTFGRADRGRTERVDVLVALQTQDTDGDGMDDSWELQYFGSLVRNGTGDLDGDGLSDFAEFKAGTDPNNAQSRFAFVDIRSDPLGGLAVRWSSVSLKTYAVHRSSALLTGYAVLQTNLVATPGTNYFRDATATNLGPYFYRVRVE